jgi:hypothetical protein
MVSGCIPVLASRCGGSFNPEPAATAQHADTVAAGSGLNDLKTPQRNSGNAPIVSLERLTYNRTYHSPFDPNVSRFQ